MTIRLLISIHRLTISSCTSLKSIGNCIEKLQDLLLCGRNGVLDHLHSDEYTSGFRLLVEYVVVNSHNKF